MTPPHTDENDNNLNNVDEGFENDNISVTGSPPLANSTEDDERRSASPLPAPPSSVTCGSTGGAFTSLIQRNNNNFQKSDFLSGFPTHLQHQQHHPLPHQPQQHAFNHALAAQLFLQSPLMPQPSQWLYSQLYGNYNDLPWFRTSIPANGNNNGVRLINIADQEKPGDELTSEHMSLSKRSVTLISHQDDEPDTCPSPPVTSTKRTPSPDDVIEIVTNHKNRIDTGVGAIKCRTPKHTDVWRPY